MTMRVSKSRIDMDDKVLQKPVLKDYGETAVTANTGSSYTINLQNGNVYNLTLTANCSFTFSNPPTSGVAGSFTLILTQDGTGGRSVTWPGAVLWPDNTEPTLLTAADSVNVLHFYTLDGGNIWYGSVTGSYAPLELSFRGVSNQLHDTTTYNFTNVSIGTASDDRLVIVGACSSEAKANRSLSSVSIGGSTATLHAAASAVNWHPVGIASRVISSGTTTDISITFNASVDNAVIFVWTLKNYKTATPHDSDATQGTESSSRSVTLDIPADGVALFVSAKGRTTAINWSSATEDNQSTVDYRSFAAATKTTESAISSHTETTSFGTSLGGSGLAGVSWS